MQNHKPQTTNHKRIVIFASGGGSNAESIINYFKNNEQVEISSFFVNKAEAGAIQRAENHNIPCVVFNREEFKNGDVLDKLNSIKPDLIVLAGFLWLIPSEIVKAYQNRIVNIHPALLPKYGGKGMHGMNVHRAVKEAGDLESGMTIHYVTENYDEGNIIFQGKCQITSDDTAEDIAGKVLQLEHKYYVMEIEKMLN